MNSSIAAFIVSKKYPKIDKIWKDEKKKLVLNFFALFQFGLILFAFKALIGLWFIFNFFSIQILQKWKNFSSRNFCETY